MTNDANAETLRAELNKIQDQIRRSRRRAAWGFTVLVLALILSFAYAFVQQVAAEKNAEEANRQRILAEAANEQAAQNAVEAQRQEAMAKEQRAIAEQVQINCQAELERCRKGRK